jgi:hypothetical protein
MVNIAELLKNAPYGTELWCTLYGEVYFISIDSSSYYPIKLGLKNSNTKVKLDKYGRYYDNFEEGECILFPSKDYRTWEGWKISTSPKFKVGDWIIFDSKYTIPMQITSVKQKDGIYVCKTIEGLYGNYNIANTDKDYHLWTISDARDGDILATDGNWICIFKSFNGYISSHCFMDTNDQFHGVACETHIIRSKLHPATKEQSDMFFAEMKEEGFKWNSDKKELRKIQHYDISNFYAGMPVLVRDANDKEWRYVVYSHYTDRYGLMRFNAGATIWNQCIPFNDYTKHLLGTIDMCPEEFINW